MRPFVPLLALALFVLSACDKPAPAPAPEPLPPVEAEAPPPERSSKDGIKLPESLAAQPLGAEDEFVIFLNVNEQGKVLLLPADQLKDAQGNAITTLDNPVQVENFLKRRAKEDRAAVGGKDKPLRSLIVLRIDKGTPFEKTNSIARAASKAGYERLQMRALRAGGGPGQLALLVPKSDEAMVPDPLADAPVRYTAVVRATNSGKVAKVTLREEGGLDLGTDIGADLNVAAQKIKAAAEKHKGMSPKLTIEIEGKLLHAHVVQLMDAGILGGFGDVTPVLLDLTPR